MIILSFNIIGGDIKAKRKRISQLINLGKDDICLFHETKFMLVDSCLVSNMWINEEVEWSARNSVEKFGGLLFIWRWEVGKQSLVLKGLSFRS